MLPSPPSSDPDSRRTRSQLYIVVIGDEDGGERGAVESFWSTRVVQGDSTGFCWVSFEGTRVLRCTERMSRCPTGISILGPAEDQV